VQLHTEFVTAIQPSVYVIQSDQGTKSHLGITGIRDYTSLPSMTYTNEPKVTGINKGEQKDALFLVVVLL
jgi:hypothetical protein